MYVLLNLDMRKINWIIFIGCFFSITFSQMHLTNWLHPIQLLINNEEHKTAHYINIINKGV